MKKRLRNRCFATATDINGCSVARLIDGRYRSIDRDYQGQLSCMAAQVQSILMYSYATRGLGFLVRCATISRQLASKADNGAEARPSIIGLVTVRLSWHALHCLLYYTNVKTTSMKVVTGCESTGVHFLGINQCNCCVVSPLPFGTCWPSSH